jgi:hypothetical protein
VTGALGGQGPSGRQDVGPSRVSINLGGVGRILGGALSFLTGIGVQVVKHENCVWIGLEVLVGVGMGLLAFELGRHSAAAPLTPAPPTK